MRDHLSGFTLWKRANGTGDRGAYFSDQAAAESAKDEWLKSQSGPLSTISCTLGIGFFKLDSIFASKEFSELPKQEQDFLQRETVPVWEILSVCVPCLAYL